MLKRSHSHGIATAVGLTVMLVVVILTFAIAAISLENLNTMTRNDYGRRALYAAEAGLNNSLASLHSNIAWSTGFTARLMPNNQTESYTVHVGNNSAGSSGWTDPFDGTTVPAGMVYLHSTGFHDTPGSSHYVAKTEVAFVTITSAVGTFALFGANSLSITGTGGYIDAWNSFLGPYTPHPPPWTVPGTANVNAPIGTNSILPGALTTSPQEYIDGNVNIGPGGSAGVVVSGLNPSNLTGAIAPQNTANPLPPVTDPLSGAGAKEKTTQPKPNLTLPPGRYNTLTATKGTNPTVTLNSLPGGVPGVYSFGGDVSMSDATLNVNIPSGGGPVIVYLDGNWSTLGTNIVNPTLVPSNFQIYGTDTTTAITMTSTGASSPYAVVYAPQAAISFNFPNSNFFGGIVGQSFTSTGNSTNFHFDLSLKNFQTVPIAPILTLSSVGRL